MFVKLMAPNGHWLEANLNGKNDRTIRTMKTENDLPHSELTGLILGRNLATRMPTPETRYAFVNRINKILSSLPPDRTIPLSVDWKEVIDDQIELGVRRFGPPLFEGRPPRLDKN